MSTITIKQDTLDSILTRLAALETDNDRLRTGMHNFNVDRNEADERIEDLKSRCDDLEVDNAELHEKNVELRESLASVESEVDAITSWDEKHWKKAYYGLKSRMDLASGQAARDLLLPPKGGGGKTPKTPPPVAPRSTPRAPHRYAHLAK